MNVKFVLTLLCGIWAVGIGARVSYALMLSAPGTSPVFMYPRFVLFFDFVPLFVFGFATLAVGIWEYGRDLQAAHVGDVMKNE